MQFALLFCRPWIRQLELFQTMSGESLIGDPTLACLPAVFLFLAPSVIRPGQSVLTWSAVHEKFDFGLLLLIGGSLAIANGFRQSGLDVSFGDAIASELSQEWVFPPARMLVLVGVCGMATQLFSAVGTASAMIPLLTSAAERALQNPLLFVLPATAACSFAFMLPTATPANIVVLAKSRDFSTALRVRDFFLTGLPVNAVMLFVGAMMMYVLTDAMFDSHAPLPAWACQAPACVWAHVSGTIHGVDVSQQACAVDLAGAGDVCRLANGTSVDYIAVGFTDTSMINVR